MTTYESDDSLAGEAGESSWADSPTPEEIASRAAAIRAEWSPRRWAKVARKGGQVPWSAPLVGDPHIGPDA